MVNSPQDRQSPIWILVKWTKFEVQLRTRSPTLGAAKSSILCSVRDLQIAGGLRKVKLDEKRQPVLQLPELLRNAKTP